MLTVLSLVFGIGLRDMWGMPMWSLSGLLAVSFILPASQGLTTIKLSKALMIWLAIATALTVIYVGFGDKIRDKPSRMQWPEQAIAAQAQTTWQSLSSCPLDSVSGDRWLGALVAMNNGFPSQMISGPASHSPWMTTERLQQNGTLVLSQDSSANSNSDEKDDIVLPLLDEIEVTTIRKPDGLANSDLLVKQQGQWQIAWREANITEPLLINWVAYIPSHCAK